MGMFRFATYAKLGVHNRGIVGGDGRTFVVESGSFDEINYYFTKRGGGWFLFSV